MKFLLLLLLISCGKDEGKYVRCRSADEAQMKCQVEYAEEFRAFSIPDWVKERCVDYYPGPGCYYDSSKRHYW
jgi:hypothetical protein